MKNLGQIMKQAQELQEKMGQIQAEIEKIEVEGQSGGGLVKLTLSGKGALVKLSVDPSLLQPTDKEMVEDLIVAAHAEAKKKVEAKIAEQQAGLLGGLPLPPGLKLPF